MYTQSEVRYSYRSFTFTALKTAQVRQTFKFQCFLKFCLSEEIESGSCGVKEDKCPQDFKPPGF